MKKTEPASKSGKRVRFFCVMETAVLSPVPQPFDGFLALVVGKIAGILTSTHYGRVQQTGIVIYLSFDTERN